MVGLVIKKLPEHIHQRLKDQAAKNHRSMTKEVISLLEKALEANEVRELPPPYRVYGDGLITNQRIDEAKREGRE